MSHWILRTLDRVQSLGDWPVLAGIAFAAGVVFALAVTGQL